MKSKCILMLTVFSMACSMAAPLNVQAGPAAQNNAPAISARADDIRWVYREIGGKLYKRLYNHTLNKWIGEWIPA